jgi:hypothetical protein
MSPMASEPKEWTMSEQDDTSRDFGAWQINRGSHEGYSAARWTVYRAAVVAEVTRVTGRLMAAQAEQLEACPECRAGKHDNCTGYTWNWSAYRPAPCPCETARHGKAGDTNG